MSGQRDLFRIYDSIQSNVKAQKEGLQELKHALNTTKDLNLNDKGYLKMLEILFTVISKEKVAYNKPGNRKKNKGETLDLAASTLRAAVEHGVKVLRGKSIKALIQHIIGTLPQANDGLFQPISINYVKSLRTVLEYTPHIEHLPQKEWAELVIFCCQGMQFEMSLPEEGSDTESLQGERGKRPLGRAGNRPMLSRDSSSISWTSTSLVVPPPRLKSETEELMLCLQLLLQVPNAPITSTADPIEASLAQKLAGALLGFLKSHMSLTSAHISAFSSLNSILANVSTNNIKLAADIAKQIPSIIARLWESKTALALKEQMLISLIHSFPHIRAQLREACTSSNGESIDSIRNDLDNLLASLMNEYTNSTSRMAREQLQLDEIEFPEPTPMGIASHPLALRAFQLRSDESARSEQLWMILHLIASLIFILDKSSPQDHSAEVVDDDRSESETRSRRRKSKRRKVVRKFDEVLHQASSSSVKTKLVALQIIPFLLDQRFRSQENTLSDTEWVRVMTDLSMVVSEDNATNSSWAMLGIASGAFSSVASHAANSPFWYQTWQLCSRRMTNPATCRAACHLMRVILSRNLIAYSDISKSVDDTLLSMDLNGPAVLIDSAFDLWTSILEKRKKFAHSLSLQPEEKLVQWFTSRWRPVDGLERTAVVHSPSAGIVLPFLFTCFGENDTAMHLNAVHRSYGPIARAWIKYTHDSKLLKYLLLEAEDEDEGPTTVRASISTAKKDVSTKLSDPSLSLHRNVSTLVIDFIDRETINVEDRWHAILRSNVKSVTPGAVQNLASFLFISTAVMSVGMLDIRSFDNLNDRMKSICRSLTEYLGGQECTELHINAVLDCLSTLLPNPDHLINFNFQPPMAYDGVFRDVLRSLSTCIEARLRTREDAIDDDTDMEDFDLPVRKGLGAGAKEHNAIPREALEAMFSPEAARNYTITILRLLTAGEKNAGDLSKVFIDYALQLPIPRLLFIKPIIVSFLVQSVDLSADDCVALMEHFGFNILQSYDFDRCETSLDFVLEATKALMPRWISQEGGEELKDRCESIYRWMTDVCLENNLSSHTLRMAMAQALHRVLWIDRNFKAGEKSARTHFIFLLKDIDIRVELCMAELVPKLFEIYPLAHHAELYKDIHGCLHRDTQWAEKLAMRCYILSQLATASHTIKRQVVYYIFETAILSEAADYAIRCVASVSKALGLKGPRDLFRMFSTQLLFTWIRNHGLELLPLRACGYSTQEELFEDMEDEIVAQLLMHDFDDDAEDVAKHLGKSYEDLLAASFHRIIAYGTAWPIQTPPQEGTNSKKPHVDSRVRKRLGEEQYTNLCATSFPLVVAILFQTMEQDGTFEKILSRDATLSSAKFIMHDIINFSVSDAQLPAPMKPCFKVKTMLTALHHICRRWGIDEATLWGPNMFVFVARKLFDTIDPGLGPLHACSVIRKLRLLICLAGKTVHEGYPLEMLIHGLRPFVVDPFCAQDTVGIIQYLFVTGKAHLKTNPTFVVGTFLSMMASLRDFIQTTADPSQVDATQYRGSQSTAQSFHSWLCDYLSEYTSASMSPANAATFKAIVKSAIGFKSNGNALRGTQESELLRVLLLDEIEPNGLLDEVSRRLAFSLISSNFEKPRHYREDIFGADEQSVDISKVLLRTCRKFNVSDEYLLWSARVLGRAYAATGIVHSEWTEEYELPQETTLSTLSHGLAIAPKASILKQLTGLLFSEDRKEVGLAEISLIDILHQDDRSENPMVSELISSHLWKSLRWECPPDKSPPMKQQPQSISKAGEIAELAVEEWVKRFTLAIALSNSSDAVCGKAGPLLLSVEGLAETLFPYLLHILLIREVEKKANELRMELSKVFRKAFKSRTQSTIPHMIILIKTILYLRTQGTPQETSKLARDDWLDIDYQDLARAACLCKMFRTALMFVEIHCSRHKTDLKNCMDILLEIYKNTDDPDSFYGLNHTASLETVLNKFEYEQDGWKCLSFRGAQMESSMRLRSGFSTGSTVGVIDSLNTLGLNGLSYALLQSDSGLANEAALDNLYESAWKLEQWDLPCPTSYSGTGPTVYRALQSINNNVNTTNLSSRLDPPLLGIMRKITAGKQTRYALGVDIRRLAMLTEVEEVLCSEDPEQLKDAWVRLESRIPWMYIAKFSEVEEIFAIRQSTFSSIVKRPHLQNTIHIDLKTARMYEAQAHIGVCKLARAHKVLQHALSATTQLSELIASCEDVGLDISAVATLQAASVLWEQGETTTSIRMLQELVKAKASIAHQDIRIGRSELLSILGTWISEARLEKPEVIMGDYLMPAIMELRKGPNKPEVAGRVFHEFAVFCDQQLNNPNTLEEYERVLALRESKQAEISEAQRLIKDAHGDAKEKLTRFKDKTDLWLKMDDDELLRLRNHREIFLESSISNYLQSLEVCDDYDQDAIRFCALWLQYSTNEKANSAVQKYLENVPSRKFVPLINQLSSRLSDQKGEFQKLLFSLVLRICRDHPYHGLYQIVTITKSKMRDHPRTKVANTIVSTIRNENTFTGSLLRRLLLATGIYTALAGYRVTAKTNKLPIRRALPQDLASKIERDIPGVKLPPPTMNIEVRMDCDYSKLPYLQRFNPDLSVASGASAPKILTCHDSAGQSYKLLVKGGNDDLRQDAIMEQVFEQVSHILQKNRETRQRNLNIRTYKVIPLNSNTGIIEFVPNTIPLLEYLFPAHVLYHPNEWPPKRCRELIQNVAKQSHARRAGAFMEIMQKFTPVLRYFFLHNFNGPDEWFRSRLAYTRSTAAISILGYVLGLGDRHGHNILLDEKSGEVVHIDLGVAFEQGRILPIPETVPFRLTRDIVDGMGVTGTEGVFRRCCEFTLSVLRAEKGSIITILDVLRYDPLYSWTVSALKVQRMQRDDVDTKEKDEQNDGGDLFIKPNANKKDEAEAERALAVVTKKLSATLSVDAAVNELIQQASDVKNLAFLYSGWGAYA